MQLDDETRDAITELINIGVGKAAGLLNDISQSNIRLQVPEVRMIQLDTISSLDKNVLGEESHSAVFQEFHGRFSGVTALVFLPDSARSLVQYISGEDGRESDMDAVYVETLIEIGNILINAVMGSISNVLSEHLTFSLPQYQEGPVYSIAAKNMKRKGNLWVIIARTNFLIEARHVEGTMILVLETGSFEQIVERVSTIT